MDQARQQPQPRSLRQHLSELKTVQQTRGQSVAPVSASSAHEELLAQVSQEACDIEYERWDGMA